MCVPPPRFYTTPHGGDVTMADDHHGSVCDVCGGGAVKVRVLFEQDRCRYLFSDERWHVGYCL